MPDAPPTHVPPIQLIHPLPVNTALIVEPVLADAVAVASTLTAHRFQVTIASTFANAKERLNVRPPEVLVADIRLGEYNGLQLVLRAKSQRPSTAAIVTSEVHDPVLQADAEALGATFVLKPIVDEELAAAIFRTIFQSKQAAAVSPLRPLFERRQVQRRADVIPITPERRRADRRRDLDGLLRAVARGQ
jgi:DNA-binding response OmpR family regulator